MVWGWKLIIENLFFVWFLGFRILLVLGSWNLEFYFDEAKQFRESVEHNFLSKTVFRT